MLTPDKVKDIIVSNKRDPNMCRKDRVYYAMSLHIDGAEPSYIDSRYNKVVYPINYYGEEYQQIFEQRLFSKYPNETDETRQYRLSQYRPYQQEFFIRAIQVITGSIFQDGNYSISIDNKDDFEYVWDANFSGKDLVSWFAKTFTDICNDPNGYVIVIPKKSRLEQFQKVEPDLWFIPHVDILYVDNSDLIFTRDKIIWWVNEIGYFRFKKNKDAAGADSVELLDEGGYYAHMLGELPAKVAGGIWNSKGFYNSWLYAAKAIADEFIGEKSLSQLVNKNLAHPIIVISDEECTTCGGVGQIQICKKCHLSTDDCGCDRGDGYPDFWTKASCNTCGGTRVMPHDISKVRVVPKEDMGNPQAQIIAPNPEIPKVQFENVKEVENRLNRALHLNYIEQAQSGIAKDRDMETRYQFFSSIANSLFDDHIYNSLRFIVGLRNVVTKNGVILPDSSGITIDKPTQFAIMTASQLKEGLDSIPDYLKSKQIENYVDKAFGGDEILKRKTEVINALDKISQMSNDRVQMMLLNRGIERSDLLFNVNLPIILNQMIVDLGTKWFLTSHIDEIRDAVNEKFKEINIADRLRINSTSFSSMGVGMEGDETI